MSSASLDTPLTHVRTGGKIITSFSTGQRPPSSSATAPHPLTTTSVRPSNSPNPDDQASAQPVSGQSASVRMKGPVTRSSTVRSSSPIPNSDAPPISSDLPTDKSASSVEKLRSGGGLSSEELVDFDRPNKVTERAVEEKVWPEWHGDGCSWY